MKVLAISSFENAGTSGDGYLGAQAAAKYINAHGGINGRPLAIEHCVDDNDPNKGAACATKASQDSSIVATIAQATTQGASVDPILENAGIASIGAIASVAADFKSPIIFAPTIGGLSGLGIAGDITDLLGGTKVGLVYVQNPAGATTVSLINTNVLTPRGLPNVTAVGIPPTATDLSPVVAKSREGSPDGIIMYAAQAQAAAFVKAAKQQGLKSAIVLSGAVVTEETVKQQFGDTSNLYFGTLFNRTGPFYDQFEAQWVASGKSASSIDDYALNGWLAATMFADVVRKVPSPTRSTILAAFNQLTNYDTGGLLPPLSFDKPSTILGGGAPRVVNPTMGLLQFSEGKFVRFADGKMVNPFVAPTK